jgi:putative transposon-encoded protein
MKHRRILALIMAVATLAIVQYAGFEAQAQSSYFTSRGCSSCHVAPVTATCNGCHHHGSVSLAGATNKTSYAPGETVSVTISGGSRSGWVRAILYDQSNTQVAISSGNASGMGHSTTLPAVLSAPAPATPGTYTWKAAWFGNSTNTGSTHGQVTVSTNSFTVTAPVDVTKPTLTLSTLADGSVTHSATLNISGTVSDASGIKSLTINNVAVTVAANGSFSHALQLAKGANTVTTVATDNANNQTTDTRTITLVSGTVQIDFDADGKSDIGVWRPGIGAWLISLSGGGTPMTVPFGTAGDKCVSGDYDGDGKIDIAVWRPADGCWYILKSSTGTQSSANYGSTGDTPVPGDYDGDGKTDLAVWRVGMWFIKGSAAGTQVSENFGTTGDIPVPCDYDGDGKTDLAVWRPASGAWYIKNSSTGTQTVKAFGASTDIPVPGDFDGDGKTDLAVWRPAGGAWYILNSATGNQTVKAFGASADIPVPGDFDGDGKTDLAVWRPAGGAWYILNSSTGTQTVKQWGQSTDLPVKPGQPIQ